MRRLPLSILVTVMIAAAPGLALARVGAGSSMGSRGMNTYSAPPPTATSPFSAAPIERSFTPQAPSYAPQPGYGATGGYRPQGAFTSGLLGGLLGAGLGGMLFGGGMFGGMHGGSGIIGLMIQLALLYFGGRFIWRLVMNRQALAGGPAGGGAMGGFAGPAQAAGGRRAPPPIALNQADYQQFEQLLKQMQYAWSAEDLNGLRAVSTPEMAGYFAEQLAGLRSRGLRNTVTDVRLLKGDLSQAWSEGSREYATVAMRFAMIDVTRDAQGRVVDGSPAEEQVVTELWTFIRSPGGRWLLSAIQQAR